MLSKFSQFAGNSEQKTKPMKKKWWMQTNTTQHRSTPKSMKLNYSGNSRVNLI